MRRSADRAPKMPLLGPEKPIQTIPLDELGRLTENDVLFLDSSHVLAMGSDVRYELLEILPSLAPGVIVHVHDIFFPFEYPRSFTMEKRSFWTEQYLLQAFLALISSLEVLAAASWRQANHPDLLREVIPSWTADRIPGSFWMRRTR